MLPTPVPAPSGPTPTPEEVQVHQLTAAQLATHVGLPLFAEKFQGTMKIRSRDFPLNFYLLWLPSSLRDNTNERCLPSLSPAEGIDGTNFFLKERHLQSLGVPLPLGQLAVLCHRFPHLVPVSPMSFRLSDCDCSDDCAGVHGALHSLNRTGLNWLCPFSLIQDETRIFPLSFSSPATTPTSIVGPPVSDSSWSDLSTSTPLARLRQVSGFLTPKMFHRST